MTCHTAYPYRVEIALPKLTLRSAHRVLAKRSMIRREAHMIAPCDFGWVTSERGVSIYLREKLAARRLQHAVRALRRVGWQHYAV